MAESPAEIVALYHSYGTSEQFHSEVKSDLDVERLPSGKFKTNATFLQLTMLAYNILRTIGQGIMDVAAFAPRKLEVARRRLRSVIQDLIFIGCKIVNHAGAKSLKFGRNCPWYKVFSTLYEKYC